MKYLLNSALAALLGTASAAHAQDGTVSFKVEIVGDHKVSSADGGHRNIQKKRTFVGSAQLAHNGSAFFSPQRGAYGDAWSSTTCSGEIFVKDRGVLRRIDGGEGVSTGMSDVELSLDAEQKVGPPTPIKCGVSLVYDPTTDMVNFDLDPGIRVVKGIQRTGRSAERIKFNAFGWSSAKKMFGGRVKVTGNRTGHAGALTIQDGAPHDAAGRRAPGEVVTSTTTVTWNFNGTPKPPKARTASRRSNDSIPQPTQDQMLTGACIAKVREGATNQTPTPKQIQEMMACMSKDKGKTGN
jgi:hypothetical protein